MSIDVFKNKHVGRSHFKVNGKPTPSPEAFVKAIEDIPDRQYFPVHWYDMREFRNMDAFQHFRWDGPFDL